MQKLGLMAAGSIPERFDESRRSSARLPLSIPIIITGKDVTGRSFSEDATTVVINRRGGKILTKQTLVPGTRIQVMIPKLEREACANVVWCGEKKGDRNEVGIDMEDRESNFWDVQFPENNAARAAALLTTQERKEMDPSMPMPLPAVSEDASDKLQNLLAGLARSAVEEKLGQALQQLDGHVQEILKRAEEMRQELARILSDLSAVGKGR